LKSQFPTERGKQEKILPSKSKKIAKADCRLQ
jgi:hypothetical protein